MDQYRAAKVLDSVAPKASLGIPCKSTWSRRAGASEQSFSRSPAGNYGLALAWIDLGMALNARSVRNVESSHTMGREMLCETGIHIGL